MIVEEQKNTGIAIQNLIERIGNFLAGVNQRVVHGYEICRLNVL